MSNNFLWVSNSLNPDMEQYFLVKKENINSCDVIWGVNAYSISKSDRAIVTSFSKKNKFSIFFFLDLFLSIYLVFYLRCKKVGVIIFDNAHISNIPLALFFFLIGGRLVFTVHDRVAHPGVMSKYVQIYNKFISLIAWKFIFFSGEESEGKSYKMTLSGFDWVGCKQKKKKNNVLFFGRLEPYKGLKFLPEIVDAVKRKRKEINFVVAGNGFDENIDLLIEKGVYVHNKFIKEEEIKNLFSNCFVVILPYVSATQSGVVLLANSYAKKVVAFDVGALSEYVNKENGVLVPAGRVDLFSESIVSIFDRQMEYPNEYEELKAFFEKNYSPQSLVKQCLLFINYLRISL